MISFTQLSKFLGKQPLLDKGTIYVPIAFTRNSEQLLMYDVNGFRQYEQWDIMRSDDKMIILSLKRDRIKYKADQYKVIESKHAIHLTIYKSGWDKNNEFHITIDSISMTPSTRFDIVCSKYFVINLNGNTQQSNVLTYRPSCDKEYLSGCEFYAKAFNKLIKTIMKELGLIIPKNTKPVIAFQSNTLNKTMKRLEIKNSIRIENNK